MARQFRAVAYLLPIAYSVTNRDAFNLTACPGFGNLASHIGTTGAQVRPAFTW